MISRMFPSHGECIRTPLGVVQIGPKVHDFCRSIVTSHRLCYRIVTQCNLYDNSHLVILRGFAFLLDFSNTRNFVTKGT